MTKRNRKTKKQTRRNERGFTLVEVLVATFLFPVLFLSVYSLLNMANVISTTNDVFSRLNQNAVQTLRNISREIAQTSSVAIPNRIVITTDGSNNSMARFQIPVDWDADGDVVGVGINNPVEWGAYDEAGQSDTGGAQRADIQGRWANYRVVFDAASNQNQLIREVLDAALNPIPGTLRVIANNVSPVNGSFVVAPPVNNVIRMTLALRGTDAIGQNGSARVFADIPYANDTVLRTTAN